MASALQTLLTVQKSHEDAAAEALQAASRAVQVAEEAQRTREAEAQAAHDQLRAALTANAMHQEPSSAAALQAKVRYLDRLRKEARHRDHLAETHRHQILAAAMKTEDEARAIHKRASAEKEATLKRLQRMHADEKRRRDLRQEDQLGDLATSTHVRKNAR